MARSIGPSFAISVLVGFAAPPLASAGELTHSATLATAPFGPMWGGNVPVPKFDPALGDLQAVRIRLHVDAQGAVRLENLSAATVDVRGGCRAETHVGVGGLPLGGPLSVATREFADTLQAFDGQRDFKGTSGSSHERLTASGTLEYQATTADPAFAHFTGQGNVDLALTASPVIAPFASGRLDRSAEFLGAVELSVTYVYSVWGVDAADDIAATCRDSAVDIAVLANDVVTAGVLDCAGVTVVVAPAHGTLDWTAGAPDCAVSHFSYQPAPGFTGTDQFTYRVGQAGSPVYSDTASVQVTVGSGPTTAADTILLATCAAPSIQIPVLANDDWAGEALEVIGTPGHGTVTVELPEGMTSGPPCIRYTPTGGFAGPDSFTYRLSNPNGCASGPTPVSVQVVQGVDAQPDAVQLCVSQGPNFLIHVLDNDGDGGAPFPNQAVTITSPPALAAGTVTALPDGTVEFVPAAGFRGTCAFQYEVVNSAGCSASTQAAIELEDAPLAVDDVFRPLNDQPVTLDVLGNDVATGAGALDGSTLTLVQSPAHGTVTVQGCDAGGGGFCRLVYTATPGYVGSDQLRYAIAGSVGCAAEAQVDLDVQDPPVLPILGGLPNRGSLLLFPEFDNSPGTQTLLTITNTSVNSSISVEFVYIEGDTQSCLEFNRTRTLTSNDTLTVLTAIDNPIHMRGYVYVFARSVATGQPVSFNHLIGNEIVATAFSAFTYSINPFLFQGVPAPDGANTDADADGIRDLNGIEYSSVADEVYVPRFLGQSPQRFDGSLIVIPLTGGARFQTTIDFLIYNDNEQVFSGQRVFPCWSKRRLLDISAAFSQNFLSQFTSDNPNEILGLPTVESGWFSLDGLVANSTQASFQDPAVLAVFIESANGDEGGRRSTADLPFVSISTQNNGDLLPHSLTGDTN